ncbi:hypothetical protein [Rhodanobacter sp. L36]|uniref:hypothetical protein n=1 Tax=Rhodanobacter sp. L36 TaxID=1747221 RepID=UPI00131B07D5|nr:hypothetical protein [Rhodanobacter sp. L36]
MFTLPRLTLVALTASLILAGCADKQVARPTAVTTTTTSRANGPTTRTVDATIVPTRTHSSTSTHVSKSHLPDHTGIPACDDYLSSYMACHKAAGIYSPGQLPSRYEAMRTSLLRDSLDPDIRPQLSARCNSLASTLRDALHGKACNSTPAAAGTAP